MDEAGKAKTAIRYARPRKRPEGRKAQYPLYQEYATIYESPQNRCLTDRKDNQGLCMDSFRNDTRRNGDDHPQRGILSAE